MSGLRAKLYAEEFGDPFDESEQDQYEDHRRQGSMGA